MTRELTNYDIISALRDAVNLLHELMDYRQLTDEQRDTAREIIATLDTWDFQNRPTPDR